jgi:hypothetical protein
MNTGPTADTAAMLTPMTMASMANSSVFSDDSASMTKASAIPPTPSTRSRRCAEYLSANVPRAGPSKAPRAMIAITTPAAETSPVISLTNGGMSSDTKAL